MLEILIWLYGTMGIYAPLDIELELLEINSMRQSAYSHAIQCSNIESPMVRFEDISWHILPGTNFSLTSSEGQVVYLRGWYDPISYIIYIPFEYRFDFDLVVHEILHSFGFTAHDEHPFTTCNV